MKISSPAEKSNSGLALAGVGRWHEGCTPRQLAHGVCQREFDGEPLRGCCKRGGEARRPEIAELHGAGWRARARELARAGELPAALPRGFLGVSHDVVIAFERGEWHELPASIVAGDGSVDALLGYSSCDVVEYSFTIGTLVGRYAGRDRARESPPPGLLSRLPSVSPPGPLPCTPPDLSLASTTRASPGLTSCSRPDLSTRLPPSSPPAARCSKSLSSCAMTSNLQVSLPCVGLGEQARAREHRIFPKSLPHGHHGLGKGGLLGVFLQLIEEGQLYAVLLDELRRARCSHAVWRVRGRRASRRARVARLSPAMRSRSALGVSRCRPPPGRALAHRSMRGG